MKKIFIIIVITTSCLSVPAAAYIGPGAGIGALGAVAALFGALLLLVVGFVWYPVKRLLRSRKNRAEAGKQGGDAK